MASPAAERSRISLPNTYPEWPKVSSLLTELSSKSKVGVEAFLSVLDSQTQKADISLLDKVLKNAELFSEEYFYDKLLPWIAGKALDVNALFKDSNNTVLNLHCGCDKEVTLSRRQVCCLMALGFFDLFKIPGVETKRHIASGYQRFTFTNFFSGAFFYSQQSKLVCLLHYFDRIRTAEEKKDELFLSANLSYTRRHVSNSDAENSKAFWSGSDNLLSKFESFHDQMIEDAHGCLQADFANEYIGGGVLGMGNVQEEIRFVISPECLVSLLFCQAMDVLESILITGAEQFSSYTGYGGRFKFTGPFNDPSPMDSHKRKQVNIVAIDAIPFGWGSSVIQFQRNALNRELYKAYCGFSHSISTDDPVSGQMSPVATGNWGCGAFGGNKQLKTLLQWMAASKAGRPVRYSTFKDERLSEQQRDLAQFLLEKKVTVGQLYDFLVDEKTMPEKDEVFSCVKKAFC